MATQTRDRILDAAEDLILERGFAGTSLGDILSQTDLTKGAFFHHFESKQELARQLMARYAERDAELFGEVMARAERLSDDPLQQVLIMLGLYEEEMDGISGPFPGCLFASYAYQAGLFDDETNRIVRDAMAHWRDTTAVKLAEAIERHPPRLATTAEDLADGIVAVFEGAFIMAMTLHDPSVISRQLRLYRRHLELLFGLE